MNDLSLVLYLADAVTSLRTVVVFVGFVSSATLLTYALMVIGSGTWSVDTEDEKAKLIKNKDDLPKKMWWLLLPISLLLVAALIPSKQTILMIAASELAESAAMSAEGQEAIDLVKNALRAELSRIAGTEE